jgi:hypothetical protein
MPSNNKFTLGSLVDLTRQLHNRIEGNDRLEEPRLQEELLAFYHTFEWLDFAVDGILDGIPEIEIYLEMIWFLCRSLSEQQDWKSELVNVPFATLMLRTFRMAILIEYCWRVM